MNPLRKSTHRQQGFVLIEAVVALVILVAVLAIFYRGWSAATASTARADLAADALALARQRLETAGIETPLRRAAGSGTAGRFDWSVTVAPHRPAEGALQRAWFVRVEVSWRESRGAPARTIALSTIKLERPP